VGEWVGAGILELGNGGGRCDSCGRWVKWEGRRRRRRGGLCEERGARRYGVGVGWVEWAGIGGGGRRHVVGFDGSRDLGGRGRVLI